MTPLSICLFACSSYFRHWSLESVRSSPRSATVRQTIRRHVPKDSILHSHRRENLNSDNKILSFLLSRSSAIRLHPTITQRIVFLDIPKWRTEIGGCLAFNMNTEFYTHRQLSLARLLWVCWLQKPKASLFLLSRLKLGPGCLNSWRHLQSMVVDQVGEEVTLRRRAIRAWVDNAALLRSPPRQMITARLGVNLINGFPRKTHFPKCIVILHSHLCIWGSTEEKIISVFF
jgi:hypothetical protein